MLNNGILMQANVMWDQASLCFCCDIVACWEMDYAALISHACVVTYDSDKWCEVEHTEFVWV